MNHQNQKDVQERIKILEEKLWDAIAYISSDLCQQCSNTHTKIQEYETEIRILRESINANETSN